MECPAGSLLIEGQTCGTKGEMSLDGARVSCSRVLKSLACLLVALGLIGFDAAGHPFVRGEFAWRHGFISSVPSALDERVRNALRWEDQAAEIGVCSLRPASP